MSTTLTALGADDVDAGGETLCDVLGVPDHVHVWDSCGVETVDDFLWWDTDCRDEERGLFGDDDVD